MRPRDLAWAGVFLVSVLGLGSCAGAKSAPTAPAALPPTEGSDAIVSTDQASVDIAPPAAEEPLTPAQLTGVPGIDKAQDLVVKILDARGTGRVGATPVIPGKQTPLPPGQWLLADSGAEYEITLRSSVLPDGIVRLSGASAFAVEIPGKSPAPQFRLFGGTASFYLPNLPQGNTEVITPAGVLVTHGAVFTVAVSPDFQVLVTCRDGSVATSGPVAAVAQPGQVLVLDRLGRSRLYAMTPAEAQVFVGRWLQVATEGAAPVLQDLLPRRLAAWKAVDPRNQPEEARFLALWLREARAVLGSVAPGPETWLAPLTSPVKASPWEPTPVSVGLLGETP